MRPFYLNQDEVALINGLRCLSGDQRNMVEALVESLSAEAIPQPVALTGNVTPLRLPD